MSNGLYSIRPMHKLDMGLHGTTSDVSLQQIGTTDTEAGVTASARWSISYNSNGFVLKSNNNPLKTLSPLLGATTANATIAAVSYSASSTAQRWTLSKLTAPHSGILLYDLDTSTIAGNIRRGVPIGGSYTQAQLRISASAYAGGSALPTIYWDSSDDAIATVNNAGAVTGVSAGTVTVSGALTADGEPEIEYTVVISELPISGYELGYNGDEWNENPILNHTNCYAYILNCQVDPVNAEFGCNTLEGDPRQQPGQFYNSNRGDDPEISIYGFHLNYNLIIDAVEKDFETFNRTFGTDFQFEPIGRYESCPEGAYKVALAIMPNGNDYHWYRQDADGYWSHKRGLTEVLRIDNSDEMISDPQTADRGLYSTFIGYFAVSPWNCEYIEQNAKRQATMQSTEGNIYSAAVPIIKETLINKIKTGMSMSDVVNLLGCEGMDIGAGVTIHQYQTEEKQALFVEYTCDGNRCCVSHVYTGG